MKNQLCLFLLIFTFNSAAFACGTADNWMDAYEGIESRNEWRDSMNRLEALVMLSNCGSSSRLDKAQQFRLSRILVQSLQQKSKLMLLPSTRYEIRDELMRVRTSLTFEALIGKIYRRFSCLPDIADTTTLRKQFADQSCPGMTSSSKKMQKIEPE